jgi:hypothetical protein
MKLLAPLRVCSEPAFPALVLESLVFDLVAKTEVLGKSKRLNHRRKEQAPHRCDPSTRVMPGEVTNKAEVLSVFPSTAKRAALAKSLLSR